MLGRSVSVAHLEADAGGLRVALTPQCTVRAFAFPRHRLELFRDRPEAALGALYILFGDDPENAWRTQAYVGRSANPAGRLADRARELDWWSEAVVITEVDGGFVTSELEQLEHDFFRLARAAPRIRLTNVNEPAQPALGLVVALGMEPLREALHMMLPRLSVPASLLLDGARQPETEGDVFVFRPRGAVAYLHYGARGWWVRRGSTAVATVSPSPSAGPRAQRESLESKGLLRPRGEILVFEDDVEFASPSAAASVVAGSTQNGRRVWRRADGRTLAEVVGAPLVLGPGGDA